jgi:hypothetical protein
MSKRGVSGVGHRFGVSQPWTRADLLTFLTLVVTVGGGLLVVATQVSGPWAAVCRVAGIVLVVIGIPGGVILPLVARRRGGTGGGPDPGGSETIETSSSRRDLGKAIEEAHKANEKYENDVWGASGAHGEIQRPG